MTSDLDQMKKYKYVRFQGYGEFVEKANQAEDFGWSIHSWQDVTTGSYIDIRAIFVSPYLNIKVFPE